MIKNIPSLRDKVAHIFPGSHILLADPGEALQTAL